MIKLIIVLFLLILQAYCFFKAGKEKSFSDKNKKKLKLYNVMNKEAGYLEVSIDLKKHTIQDIEEFFGDNLQEEQ